jgi:hypothetical protein
MKEIKQLCNIGVLEWGPSSRWTSPTCIIPKRNSTVHTISDFRELHENCYAMTFGGDYHYKDDTESMMLSASAESMILSVGTESMILSAGLLLPPLPYNRHSLKFGSLNGHAICTYFVGKYGRLLEDSTLNASFSL